MEDQIEQTEQEEQQEEDQQDTVEGAAGEDTQAGADDAIEITIGDDEPPKPTEKAPDWVRELRQRNKELARENKELRERTLTTQQQSVPALGERPKLSDKDIDYDEDKFNAALDKWNERKSQLDQADRQRKDAERTQQEAWAATLKGYDTAKTALKVNGMAEAEDAVREAFSVVQQGIMLQGMDGDSAAKLMYAIGRSPDRLQKLSAIQDPVKFAVAIGEAKALMKTAPRKQAPNPETQVRGGAPGVTSTSAKLDQLEKQAEKTGDYTEFFRAQRELRKKQK